MNVPTTFLVAVDGSQPSRAAERFAAELADRLGDTRLLLAHVVPPGRIPPISPGFQPSLPTYTIESGREWAAAEELLREAENRVRAIVSNPTVTIERLMIEASSPAKGLVDRSQDMKDGCRMIVLGNRGHSEIASLVLGSVADQVLHTAECPVVVVKA